jgi:hypothetical protein
MDDERDRNPNIPRQPMVRMNPRHRLNQVKGSYRTERTTLVPPEMNETVESDLEGIRRGDGEHLGNNVFRINERVYAWERADLYYPVRGPGFIVAERATLKALQTLRKHGGITDAALNELARDPGIPHECVESAKDLWLRRTNRGES